MINLEGPFAPGPGDSFPTILAFILSLKPGPSLFSMELRVAFSALLLSGLRSSGRGRCLRLLGLPDEETLKLGLAEVLMAVDGRLKVVKPVDVALTVVGVRVLERS